MRSVSLIFLSILVVFTFQNCGSFKGAKSFQYYTYSSSPDFFYDIKLVEASTDELGREKFSFDIVLAYVHDVSRAVSYSVNFSTKTIPSVCSPVTGVASEDLKHFRVQCLLPVPDELYIKLLLAGPNGEQESLDYRY